MNSEKRYKVRFVNRFCFKYALLVCAPSIVVIGIHTVARDANPTLLLAFGIGILLVAVLIGILTGRNMMEIWEDGKWKRLDL
jgi:hypothetical protein